MTIELTPFEEGILIGTISKVMCETTDEGEKKIYDNIFLKLKDAIERND